MSTAGCFFCGTPATFGPFNGVQVCESCASLIGAVASRNPGPVWAVAESAPLPFFPRTQAEVAEAVTKASAVGADTGRPPATHVEVVEKFVEQGFYHLAVRSSSQVLLQGNHGEKRAVLAILLAAPLLKPEGLVILKRLLHAP